MGDATGAMRGLQNQPGELEPRSTLTLEVRGRGSEMRLPRSLLAWDPPMLPIARKRVFDFTVAREPMNEFISFGINATRLTTSGSPIAPTSIRPRNGCWSMQCDNKLMDHAHVYDIHVNPFKIIAVNGQRSPTPLWRDTYVLTKRTGDSLTFESNFVDFTGKFVEHCHVIAHEDLGMMASVEVVA
jgi:FtsP/CotA-like multicopper oxidase with cupredoxin domain